MRILLMGGTGAIGRRLSPRLVAAGHAVTVITRRPERVATLRAAGLTPVVADALDSAAVDAVLAASSFELVMHQLTDLSDADSAANARLRRIATRNVVDAALRHGVGRIVAQSISWAYEPGDGPADEDVPLDLLAPAPRSTTVGAVAALESAVAEVPEGVVLRYGTLYGPGTWYERAGRIGDQVVRGRLPATPEITSFLHVDDAAQAAVDALGWPAGRVNVVDDEPARVSEWLPLYSAALGGPPPPADPTAGTRSRPVSNRRAAGLGWRPAHPTWRTALLDGS